MSRTRAYAISARRSTPTARFIRSSARWSARRTFARRHPASEARQARCDAGADLNLNAGRGLFAEMLSLPNDGRYPALELTPQQRRQRTLEALTSQVEALSRQNPVLMIFEDAHWTDPTSLEAFGRIVDRIRNPSRAADRDVPAGVRAALDWAALCDGPHHQPAGGARNRAP